MLAIPCWLKFMVPLVYIVVLFLFVGGYIFLNLKRKSRLKNRTSDHNIPCLENKTSTWEQVDKEIAQEVFHLLASKMEVDSSQLKLSDRFDKELMLSKIIGIPDHGMLDFVEDLKLIMKKYNITDFTCNFSGKTIGDLLDQIKEARNNSSR